MLVLEKQAAEEARKVSAEAESKNVDLAKKLEEAEGKVDQLQDSTQRYIYNPLTGNVEQSLKKKKKKEFVEQSENDLVNYQLSRKQFICFTSLLLMVYVLYYDCFFCFIRLEEKLSNLESENQVLRQQALTMSPTGKAVSARPRTTIIQVMLISFLYIIFVSVRHSYLLGKITETS